MPTLRAAFEPSPTPTFLNRRQAGRQLAARLTSYRDERPVVVALPRGGVPVAYEIARALGAPLELCMVRKIGLPGHEEVGLGAVAEGGHCFISPGIAEQAHLAPALLPELIREQLGEVMVHMRRFRRGRPPIALRGRTVIVVDDGVANGGTVRAALAAVRAQSPRKVVLAVPVGAAHTITALAHEYDDVACLLAPQDLQSVGRWYEDFRQVTDERVMEYLELVRSHR